MGENSKIEWTHHTFNPWRGCTKVSSGCANCYAEKMSGRNPSVLGVWGPRGLRVPAAESYWRQLAKWNREAERDGERRRVFVASLADVAERDETMPEWSRGIVVEARKRLWSEIEKCPSLDFLLLTKRPDHLGALLAARWSGQLPENIWAGASVENQGAADDRIPQILQIPARVRFLSCEPLLSMVTLRPEWLPEVGFAVDCGTCRRRKKPRGRDAPMQMSLCDSDCSGYYEYPCPGDLWPGESRRDFGFPENLAMRPTISWVICGGESGPHARPMHPFWARSLRDQCVAAGVPFLFKQWGEWAPGELVESISGTLPTATWFDGWDFGRENLATEGHVDDEPDLYRLGKRVSGRLLDGQTWDEVPE